MIRERIFWIRLCLVNLSVVALFGLLLRSKILFSLPFLNYRNVLSAHSHVAFAGWAGMALMTLLIYDLLPKEASQKKQYQLLLWSTEISSVGMALTFPFFGYNVLSIFFSSLNVLTSFIFSWIFIKELRLTNLNRHVRLLCYSAILSLILSYLGPLGISYILVSGSGNSTLYRDSIYFFLHFQYNGFFTLSVFALFLHYLLQKGMALSKPAERFSFLLSLSVIPSLFLSLLWHSLPLYYVLAAVGCVLIMLSLFYFIKMFSQLTQKNIFSTRPARNLFMLAFLSFGLKMALHIGTIFPGLGNAVYGARPVIIGFLHLVFLGFITFFILSVLVENQYFNNKQGRVIRFPLLIFGLGIIANETLLMLQGLSILMQTNHAIYNWLLLGGSGVLFIGALCLIIVHLYSRRMSIYK